MESQFADMDIDITHEKKTLNMICGAFCIPKEKSQNPLGDDAHFICEESQTIGVADGVGGWWKMGVDPGEYARQLIRNCAEACKTKTTSGVDPRQVLEEAYSITKVEGSSTACILTLKDNHLHAANLGDSGFLLIRDGRHVFQSTIQQHSFNNPYQLRKDSAVKPSSAQIFKMAVKAGDVVVVGTDGVFDNAFVELIEVIVNSVHEEGVVAEQAAWAVAEHAYQNSLNKTATTPWSIASRNAGKWHRGGKQDDITVIVAYIVDQ